jgi:hypothetical protein
MNDPVLNRKMFRTKALRTRAIRPQRYNVGTGIMGVEGTPFFTNESQGMGPNETRTFTKGSKVYTVNSAGQVIKVDTLPIQYQAPKKENIFFRTAERLLDPEGYKKNIADVKRFGKYMASPDPYLKAGKFGAGLSGYLGAEALANQVLPEGGANAVSTGLMGTGIAQLAEGLGAGKIPLAGRAVRLAAGPGRLLMNPYVGIPVALTAAGIYGAKKLDEAMSRPKEFTETDGFLGPAGTKTYVESPYAKQKREYEKVMKIQDPREKELAMGNRPDLFSPMSPDDMMMSAPLAGSELAQQQATVGGAGGTTPPGEQPPVKIVSASSTKESGISKEVPTNITGGVDKKTEELNKSSQVKKQIKNPESTVGMFDRLKSFSQSEAGNMFMLKFAAGLLSGKGGFGEVVGNALNPAVDVYAAYKLKEQEFDNKLLIERYKQMKEAKGKVKLQVGSFPINNEDGTQSYVQAYQDENTKQTTAFVNGKEIIIPADQAGLFSSKKSEVGAKQLDLIGKLGDNSGATSIINDLLLQDPQTLGTAGAVSLFGTRLASVAGAVKDIGKEVSYKDIVDINTGKKISGAGASQVRGLEKTIDKNISAIFGQMEDSTRETLAKNGVRAETLKYFLANAFKSEDRLTNRDLEFIGKITNVLAFTKGGDLIQAELREIDGYLKAKRQTFIKQLHASGYSDLDIATNIFGTAGGGIAATIYGQSSKEKGIDFKKLLPSQINEELLKKGIKG